MWQFTTFKTLIVEEIDTKTFFCLVKIKWDNGKHSLSLTRKSGFLRFSFSDISCIFFTLFQPKIGHIFSLKPFHACYTKLYHFVKFQYHLLKVWHLSCWSTKRYMLIEHQITKPEWILKFLQIITRNCLNKL